MRALAVVHQADTGPGVFADVIRARGIALDLWRPPEGSRPSLGDYAAVISLGGAMNADEDARLPWIREEKQALAEVLARGTPVLGVCLGAQLLAAAAGAPVRRARRPEIGWYEVALSDAAASDPVIRGLPERFEAFEWHSYEAPVPPGGVELATSAVCSQAFRAAERAWGIQFHAEVAREAVEGWIEGYGTDADAVAIGLDREALLEATRARIAAWNELGRGVCERFLDVAMRAGVATRA